MEIAVLKESIDEIKSDLKEHIKEDEDKLDKIHSELTKIGAHLDHRVKEDEKWHKMLEPVYRAYIGAKWSFGAIIGLAALLTAVAKLKGYL